MNGITDADRLRGSIEPQICKHLHNIINIKKVTKKNLISVTTSVILNAYL